MNCAVTKTNESGAMQLPPQVSLQSAEGKEQSKATAKKLRQRANWSAEKKEEEKKKKRIKEAERRAKKTEDQKCIVRLSLSLFLSLLMHRVFI